MEEDVRVPSLELDVPEEEIPGTPVTQPCARERLSLPRVFRESTEEEHPARLLDREVHFVRGPSALEALDALTNLEKIPDRESQGLVHVRDERRDVPFQTRARGDKGLRQGTRLLPALHERPGACLHIQEQSLGTFRELLRHDARRDQRDGLYRAGDIPQRVHAPVRGDHGLALADHREADPIECGAKPLGGEIGAVAGDGFQLVQRSTRMAQRAPAHHGHAQSAGSGQRRENEGYLVSHPACRMFVHEGPGNPVEIDDFPGVDHGARETSRFPGGHPLQDDRHEQRGELVVGDVPCREAAHEEIDFFRRKLGPIPLLDDQLNNPHAVPFWKWMAFSGTYCAPPAPRRDRKSTHSAIWNSPGGT